MYGETFYGRNTAQHQLQWSQIKSQLHSTTVYSAYITILFFIRQTKHIQSPSRWRNLIALQFLFSDIYHLLNLILLFFRRHHYIWWFLRVRTKFNQLMHILS